MPQTLHSSITPEESPSKKKTLIRHHPPGYHMPELPRDMDLTKTALNIRSSIAYARSLTKMGKPEDAKEQITRAGNQIKDLERMLIRMKKETPNHPRLSANEKMIKEAKEDLEKYASGH
jgi:hypothetical protein